ncbi:MAG: radical SAM family heme chaperone HemW [Alphaproteobacteria bacterium]
MKTGLYIHWPFCLSKCPYCDFNSHVRDRVDQTVWRDALLRELDTMAARFGPPRIDTVFFGGGTPSLMPVATAAALIERAGSLFGFSDDVEITLEANPTSVEADALAGFRDAGVDRVSMGVQSLNPTALKFLGRQHSVDEALAAVDVAAGLFDRFSFDLIYTLPNQTVDEWQDELGRALDFVKQRGGDHLSLYQLTIEPGTAFQTAERTGKLTLPEDDTAANLFEATQAMMRDAGYPAYEISNHAAAGGECRHNLIYWRGEDYLGIGPGAHARVTVDGVRQALRAERSPEKYLRRVQAEGHGLVEDAALSDEDTALERIMMGLRLTEGVPSGLLQATDAIATRTTDLIGEGYLHKDAGRTRTTEAGRLRLNALLGYLLA